VERGRHRAAGAALRCRVLLVDDEATVLATTCDVTVASNVEEAVRQLAGQQFDVVCTDYAMGGGMNGLQLLQLVSDLPRYVGKVLVTGHNEVDSEVADCYVLFKPCAPQRLLDVIERAGAQALSRRRVARATAETKRTVGQIATTSGSLPLSEPSDRPDTGRWPAVASSTDPRKRRL
jgi:DNA-binding NtrC family response regulator